MNISHPFIYYRITDRSPNNIDSNTKYIHERDSITNYLIENKSG